MSDRTNRASLLSRLSWFALGGIVVGILVADPWDVLPWGPAPAHESQPMDHGGAPAPARSEEREILFYRNPMDPTITSTVFMQDEMGMDYIPVYADDASLTRGEGSEIRIDPVVVQNMNVLTTTVERRDLATTIRTVGYLEYDQERMVTVTTKYSGWIEEVYVNYVGEPVKAGQPLFEVYSPELVQTEQELLSALQYAQRFREATPEVRERADLLVEAARTRLGYWDVSPEQIEEIEGSGRILKTLQVKAPIDGVVMKRLDGLAGMAVRPGLATFHIANLSTLWLSVEVFEDQVQWVEVGTEATVTFGYLPGEVFTGTVQLIEPEFSEQTRTMRVRLAVPNRGGKLRSGMFATVVFNPVAARDALVVPSQAVLRTGLRSVVVTDLGDGRFLPREVILGHQGGGFVEVLDGLSEGDRVVTSSQFLLDSEANLQAAVRRMIAGGKPKSPSPSGDAPTMNMDIDGEGGEAHEGSEPATMNMPGMDEASHGDDHPAGPPAC